MTTASGAVAGIAYAVLSGVDQGMGALAVVAGAAIGGIAGSLITGVF